MQKKAAGCGSLFLIILLLGALAKATEYAYVLILAAIIGISIGVIIAIFVRIIRHFRKRKAAKPLPTFPKNNQPSFLNPDLAQSKMQTNGASFEPPTNEKIPLTSKEANVCHQVPPNSSITPSSGVFPALDVNVSSHMEAYENPTERGQVPTPPNSVITYQEALSLKYWDRRRSDYVVTSCYIDGATRESLVRDLSRLLDLGFLSTGDIQDRISLKTVPELKDFLRKSGLKVSGNKPELVQRILDNFPKPALSTMFPVSKYRITEAGKKALEPYSIVFLANQFYNIYISYYRLMQAKADNPDKPDEEILLSLMKESAANLYKNGKIYSYRMYIVNIAQLLENYRRPLEAFNYYSISFFISSISYQEQSMYSFASPDTYTASQVEKCARDCGLSFQQMVTSFVDAIQRANPFGLGTEQNIKIAVQSLGTALGT